jgi:hypothetical protein
MTKGPTDEIPMTKEPNPNQVPSPNDQNPKAIHKHSGFGICDLVIGA